MAQSIRIGTRGSELALWQANHVADLLREKYPEAQVELVTFTTKGDVVLDKSLPAIGGKGLFTEELESALLKGEIDCAVHSLKDLPTENPAGLTIGAVPKRAAVNDVLISKHGLSLDKLPKGAKIGTSSLRRAAQLRHFRPDLEMLDIRGNVPTRIKKALDPNSAYNGIILAQAGVERLGLMEHVTQILPLDIMLPAPAQGAIAVQCRQADNTKFFAINHDETWYAVEAERILLKTLQGGCSVPVAAYARLDAVKDVHGNPLLTLVARVLSVDGKEQLESEYESPSNIIAAEGLGEETARDLLRQGAAKILAEVKHES